MITLPDRVKGVLMGQAVGDAVGLPAEGLSRQQIERRGWRDHWRHRLVLGRGMISDDTDHMLMVAEALSASPEDVHAFRRRLAWKFRWWLLSLPAGIGLATGRAIMKLWVGFPPTRSGVYSAGNGPAMRSAIIGAYFCQEPEKLAEYVEASTKITHTDPKALVGALAVAWCVAYQDEPDELWRRLADLSQWEGEEWPKLLKQIREGLARDWTVDEFADELGLGAGISGYVYHTVPMAIFAWLRLRDESNAYSKTMTAVFNCGGDVDTVGAIAGALGGASSGGRDIPTEWIEGIVDWPRSRRYLIRAGEDLIAGKRVKGVAWPGCLMRNLVFLLVVLFHGFARLIPRRRLK